ncbi:MAG: hypothetical protein JSV91_14255 [Phycisphaerales bacterium]|nr:MAG: hypothetical protein JSV91_14255 [Phycisphaerales bacterium]
MNSPHTPPARRSAWTTKQKFIRLLWMTAGRFLWLLFPSARSALIRLFGGSAGRGCRFARGVEIVVPWNLHVGNNVQVEDRAILYTLGPITLGDNVVIDYRAHLCAGTHDMNDSTFPLLTPPISIGDGSFIGLDAYVGPNVTLGAGCRVWPRASVYRDFPDGTSLRGNPAQPAEKGQ